MHVIGLAWAGLLAGAGLAGEASGARDAGPAPDLFPFVLPWDDATPGVADLSELLEKPAGKYGPIAVRDGHFYAGPRRIRFFGVNLCFGANFPTHEEADRVAARLAKLGVNCVRFHHMETSPSPAGLMRPDNREIDPAQLERLDYLIARLKDHGIYSNLNLHVGRVYPDRPRWQGMPSYFKGVDNFDREMIESQKRYARDLLGHVNPYTRSRYADEPAVAIVEINNENALFNEWSDEGLDDMPDPYAADLKRRWNDYLRQRYRTDQALRKAWSAKEEPRGREMLANRTFAQGLSGWVLEQQSGRVRWESARERAGAFLRLAVEEPAQQSWHIQLGHPGLQFAGGRPYTLRFRARSDRPFRLEVNAMQAHEPWRQTWSTRADVDPEWKDFQYVFMPSESDANGRITFSGLGAERVRLDLTEVSLTPGGVMGLRPGEVLGSLDWIRRRDFGARTREAQADWIRFLWGLEEDYWLGLYRFLKDELGVKAVVLGTQMGWGAPPIQARLDAIDSHAYWQHPHFPRRPWDPDDWTVENIPMAGRPDGGTLPRLGLSRVVGKPFLCTEYNHSAPNTYGSEAFPLIAAYAARQDWDGVFAFAYSHRGGEWDLRRIPSFFDIDQHPTKLVAWTAAVALFVRGDVPVAATSTLARPGPDDWIEAARRRGAWGLAADAFGVDPAAALRSYVGLALDEASARQAPPAGAPRPGDAAAFAWHSDGQPGYVTIDTPRSKALIGATTRGPYRLGDVTIKPGPNRQGWAVITLTALDGPDLGSPGRVLVTATGYAENTGMGWKDAAKTSVGRNWGSAPSLVEGIPAEIELPVPARRVRAWALDERGQRKGEPLRVEGAAGPARLAIGPEARTLWYEVEITP